MAAARIDALGIARADIAKTLIEAIIDDPESGTPSGYRAWFRFKQCRGAINVEMGRDCHVLRIYTRGECRLPARN